MKSSVKYHRDRYVILVTLLLLLVISVALIYTHPDKKKAPTMSPVSEYEQNTIEKWHTQLRELLTRQDYVNAELLAKNIRRTLPDDIFSKRAMVCCMLAKNDSAGALKQCRTILLSHPDDAITINNLAILLFAEGKNAEAAKAVNTALELYPDHPAIRHNHGFINRKSTGKKFSIHSDLDVLLLKDDAKEIKGSTL